MILKEFSSLCFFFFSFFLRRGGSRVSRGLVFRVFKKIIAKKKKKRGKSRVSFYYCSTERRIREI